MSELTEDQAELASYLACYLSIALSEVIAKRLSKKQVELLENQLIVLKRRGAEQFARDLLKMPKNKREAHLQRIASQGS